MRVLILGLILLGSVGCSSTGARDFGRGLGTIGQAMGESLRQSTESCRTVDVFSYDTGTYSTYEVCN